jgi:hypothetical protein
VANVLDYYSNSKVVRNLHIRIYGKEPLNFNKKNKISAGVIGRCFDLLSKELDTSFFNIKGEKNNKEICIYIPQEFVSLFSNLRKDLFQTQLFSEITRMCFSQGLYILSDLIVKGEIDFTDRMTKSATNSLRNIYLKYYK